MKKIFNIILAAGLLLSLTSCDKFFDGVNDNQNQPEDVPVSLLLPSTQAYLAYGSGGDISRFTAMLTQQCTGATRQFATYQQYQISENEFDNYWRFNLYGGPLMDLNIIIDKAVTNNYPAYEGVAKVMLAYGMMIATDNFGDVPYSEAFQGAELLQPIYDSQEDIYNGTNGIFALLTQAKAALAEDPGEVAPGADDLMYGGDLAAWAAFANFVEARAHLHLGKTGGSHYASALSAIDAGGFADASADAMYVFGAGETEAGPWYQYIQQRDDITYTGTIYDYMTTEGDPRYFVYLDTAGGTLGSTFAAATAPFYFGSYVEQKFMEAEAAHESGDMTRAATAHNEGVMASLAMYGLVDAAFETAHASHTAATIDLEEIMTQKWVALFLQPECFTDWRRTGFPALSPVADAVLSDIPRRFPYPLTERTYNGSNVPAVSNILAPVWWDQ